jgi:hypothetical protein
MKTSKKHVRAVWLAAVATLLVGAGCSSTRSTDTAIPASTTTTTTSTTTTAMPGAPMPSMTLTGVQEVPPNPSTASGRSTIAIGADKSVIGSVTVTGMTPTMAHIHEAAKGANGPVIVPLTKKGDMTFGPAADAKLTDAQYASYKAGNLYINVHSAAYPGGEIRLQIAPMP